MKQIIALAAGLALLGGAAFAEPADQDHGDRNREPRKEHTQGGQQDQPHDTQRGQPRGDRHDQNQDAQRRSQNDDKYRQLPKGPRWSKGDRLPQEYRDEHFTVRDWDRRNLRKPPKGYRWVCYDRGNCFLVADRTGIIRDTRWRDDRDAEWRRRYSHYYDYNDDYYYRECRGGSDPAGVLIGGLIGGLLGHSSGDGDAGSTFAGIIIGGAIGAALTRDMDCDDRSYAYRSYYSALNGGRTGVIYRWSNPRNRHHGDFHVRRYFYDADGFRCADYRHVAYLGRQHQNEGRACRQPDGAWAFLR